MNTPQHPGDGDAWMQQLFLDLARRAVRMVGRHDAEDAAIETILRFLSDRCELVGEDAGRKWAYSTLRNVCIDQHRRNDRVRVLRLEVVAEMLRATAALEVEEERREQRARARRRIANLLRALRVTIREEERRVLRLLRKGRSDQEIAVQLGVTDRSVRRTRRSLKGKALLVRHWAEEFRVRADDVPAALRVRKPEPPNPRTPEPPSPRARLFPAAVSSRRFNRDAR